jgi:hypothetical protein
MAFVHAMEALVEVGTVLPRAVRVSGASSIVRSAGDSVGVVQWVGYSHYMSATQYCLVWGIQNHRH